MILFPIKLSTTCFRAAFVTHLKSFLFVLLTVYKYYVIIDIFCFVPILFDRVAFVILIMLTCKVDVSNSHTPSLHQMPDSKLLVPFPVLYPYKADKGFGSITPMIFWGEGLHLKLEL